MQYVLKNLKSFAKNYTGVFVLIVVCQLVCILLSFFSFGVYQNFLNETNKTIEGEEPEKFEGFQCFTVDGELPENADIHPSELTDFYNSVGEILGDKIGCITTDCGDFELLMNYKDGQIIFDQQFYDNIKRQYTWNYGRCFTQREFTGGEKVCVAPSICCDEYSNKEDLSYEDEETGEIVQTNIPYKAYQRDNKWYVKIYGTEYECIGFCDFSGLYYIPQKDMPYEITLTALPSVDLTRQLSIDEYDKMTELYNKTFPISENHFHELTLVDNEEIYYYNTNMWISGLIAVISAINLALIMNYILTRRRKSLAIFRINGCSSNSARRIYITEILIILNVVFVVCLVSWIMWILPALGDVFIYMQGAFSPKIYLMIYLCYMVISYVVMNIMTIKYIRRQPVDLLKTRS